MFEKLFYLKKTPFHNVIAALIFLIFTGVVHIPRAKAGTEVVPAENRTTIPARCGLREPVRNKSVKIGRTVKDEYLGMELVYVPGGCFEMGGGTWAWNPEEHKKPVHTVCVDGFYISRYEITQGQWEKVMGNNPSRFRNCGNDCPVEQVSWHDVQKFIKKLNRKSGIEYRLPTEAEWEYAARSGGKKEIYAGGSQINRLAWYRDNSAGRTHKVGTKAPNGLGLYDMTGNVYEWCQDIYSKGAYMKLQVKNPVYIGEGSYRVIRGGGFSYFASYCRSAVRGYDNPDGRYNCIGFRLTKTN